MTEKQPPKKDKGAPKLKEAAATQRMSKTELAQLIKKAEEDDAAKAKAGAGDDGDADDDEAH